MLINEKAKPDSIFATELANANVETWASSTGTIVPHRVLFLKDFAIRFITNDPMHSTDIRGADINAGVPLSETRMPDGDLGCSGS